MNEMTIIGNVVDEPRMRVTTNGHKVTTFRVASTQRRFDREQEKFVDGSTLYMNVTSWRGAGENVFASLHKGQPVVVHGRCSTRNYTVNEQPRTSYELEAYAIGHDLFRGVSSFERVYRATAVTVEADSEGVPLDDSDHYLPVSGGDATIDPLTGEVLEDAESGAESDGEFADADPVLVGS